MPQLNEAEDIIQRLHLQPHPEGGHFCETFRDPATSGNRAWSTALSCLLRAGERSAWHRVDAAEIWHFYAGAPLVLNIAPARVGPQRYILGTDLARGVRPQIVVPAHVWQSAESLGAWTLVGCTVAPGFEFSGFEMAPAGWQPGL